MAFVWIPLAVSGVVGATAALTIFIRKKLAYSSWKTVGKTAHPGDLIEFDRGAYSHYALYLGQIDMPAHLHPVPAVLNISGEDKKDKEALILVQPLAEVCGRSKARVHNHDEVAQRYFNVGPRPIDEIMEVVKSFENRMVPYEFDFRNCEFYCTLWRYGKGFSTQVANLTMTPAGMYMEGIVNSNLVGQAVLSTATNIVESRMYGQYRELSETY